MRKEKYFTSVAFEFPSHLTKQTYQAQSHYSVTSLNSRIERKKAISTLSFACGWHIKEAILCRFFSANLSWFWYSCNDLCCLNSVVKNT